MSNHHIQGVFDWTARTEFYDILNPGWVDHEAYGYPPRFAPWDQTVYLAARHGLLRLDSVCNFGQLGMRVVESVEPTPEIVDDEDEGEEFAVASRVNQFLRDGHPWYRCTRIRYVLGPESRPADGIVQCAEFQFEGWPVVFADPEWHFGIVLGGYGAYEHWLDFYHCDDRSTLTEHEWRLDSHA